MGLCVFDICVCGCSVLGKFRFQVVMEHFLILLQFSSSAALIAPFLNSSVSDLGEREAYLRQAVKTSFHLFNYS